MLKGTLANRRTRMRLAVFATTVTVCLAGAGQAAAALVTAKYLYVSDQTAFPNGGGVLRVDVATGARTTVSNNSSPSQPGGPDFVVPERLAVEADGKILVVGTWSYAGGPPLPGVVRIDPGTGVRSNVSLNGVQSGPSFGSPNGIAVEATGNIVVNDCAGPANGPNGNRDTIFRVNPGNGFRTVLSSNSAPSSIPDLEFRCPTDVAVEASGGIVTPQTSGFPTKILRVDPGNGARTLVSADNQPAGAPNYGDLRGVTVGNGGAVLVTDVSPLDTFLGVLAANPTTGARTEISRNSNPSNPPLFWRPWDLTQFSDTGRLYVTSGDYFDQAQQGQKAEPRVIDVRRSNGDRHITSGFNNPPGAPIFSQPQGIDIAVLALKAVKAEGQFRHDRAAAGGAAVKPGFTYKLSAAAKMTFTIGQQLPGRIQGLRRCVLRTAKNKNAPACTHYRKVGSFTAQAHKGSNRTAFNSKIHGRRLARGTYVALLRGAGKNGNRTVPVSVKFTVH
jgi:hypothetical protein